MVGPDYHQPAPPVDAGYGATKGAATTTRGVGGNAQSLAFGHDLQGDWWVLFRSRTLDALIARGLAHNPGLASAQQTLLQARELARAQEGGLFPALSAAFGYSHQRLALGGLGSSTTSGATTGAGTSTAPSAANSFATEASVYDLWNAGLNVSYTVDLWGGIRRGIEQVRAQATYQRFALEAAYLSLTTNIAQAAIAEASLRAQIAATEEVVRAERQGLDIVTAQLEAGSVTRAELLQQQAQLETTLATLPPLRDQLAQQRNLLATYLGAYPNQLAAPDFDLTDLTLPDALPVSLPSALIAQRPDIQQNAALLHQRTAAVGVATANMLPQLQITGSYGSDALVLGQLFSGPESLAYSIAAGLTQPLFQGGTLLHQRRAAVAAMRAAADDYQNTVIGAVANVANALQALHYDDQGLAVARDAATAARQSLGLLQVQFKAGSIGYLSVLTAQQTLESALVTLARAQAARYADTVTLFAALGGGWWHRQDVAPEVARCCQLLP